MPAPSQPSPRATGVVPRETDEALVLRMGRGGEDALRELHHRYASLLFTVATRFVDAATAEEVVQDVFVTLWQKHETFDAARGTFKSWVVQIARRRALNELRRRGNRGRDGEEALAELTDESIEPDEAQWLAHRREVLRAAVDALPAAQRQALSLAFFDELTHEQIALVLRTPVGTTKTRIRSALKRLAPLVGVALVVVAIVLFVRRHEERAALNERALRMVTVSDVVPLRLAPAPGVSAEAHGSYRTRAGANVAVLTTSHLPALAPPDAYVAWAHDRDGWHLVGTVTIESDQRSVLVSEIVRGAAPPDEIRVTRESSALEAEPRGPVVLTWSALDPAPQ